MKPSRLWMCGCLLVAGVPALVGCDKYAGCREPYLVSWDGGGADGGLESICLVACRVNGGYCAIVDAGIVSCNLPCAARLIRGLDDESGATGLARRRVASVPPLARPRRHDETALSWPDPQGDCRRNASTEGSGTRIEVPTQTLSSRPSSTSL